MNEQLGKEIVHATHASLTRLVGSDVVAGTALHLVHGVDCASKSCLFCDLPGLAEAKIFDEELRSAVREVTVKEATALLGSTSDPDVAFRSCFTKVVRVVLARLDCDTGRAAFAIDNGISITRVIQRALDAGMREAAQVFVADFTARHFDGGLN